MGLQLARSLGGLASRAWRYCDEWAGVIQRTASMHHEHRARISTDERFPPRRTPLADD